MAPRAADDLAMLRVFLPVYALWPGERADREAYLAARIVARLSGAGPDAR